jgi:hypothetical protein
MIYQTRLPISRARVPFTERQQSAKAIKNRADCERLGGVILDLDQKGRFFFNFRYWRGISGEL